MRVNTDVQARARSTPLRSLAMMHAFTSNGDCVDNSLVKGHGHMVLIEL